METIFFKFENDFVESLKCIPMIVRYKLDTCLIKLTLAEWAKMTTETKKTLAYALCENHIEIEQYRYFLKEHIQHITGNSPQNVKPRFRQLERLD